MTSRELTRTEESILLYIETCCVDQGARLDQQAMNNEDREAIEQLTKEGLIESHGRVCFDDIQRAPCRTLWAWLSDACFEQAHRLRLERAKRLWSKRAWKSTAELRATHE